MWTTYRDKQFQMFITFTSDYLYVLAMLKTTPLVVTVGLSLTMPLAVIGDTILGKSVHGQVVLGALLVFIAFFMVGMSDSESPKENEVQNTQ
jgi:solute carrier family 35 protein F5